MPPVTPTSTTLPASLIASPPASPPLLPSSPPAPPPRAPPPLRPPRGADGHLRPQPHLQVRVHHPSGQPALHDARSGAGQFGLHPIHLAVEVGILLRQTVQFQDGQTAPPRHLPEGLAGGEVAIPQPRRQRARH